MIKIAFGMIVFEGDFVLKQCLDQVYPLASQILIAEGPVDFFVQKGKTTSEDKTNEILANYPDPENKITVVHGQFYEKDDQCRSYMQYLNEDIDYIWNLDSDEVYKQEDIIKMIEFLDKERPTSVGIQSCSFFGGFDHYLTGFELNTDNFLRIFRVTPGCTWATHRPPTIHYPTGSNIVKKHISSDYIFQNLGVQMYHYSYVFPRQVKTKIEYYKVKVSGENCIDNYFDEVYLPWVTGGDVDKYNVEKKFYGVHEFKPLVRGECYTKKFLSQHPESIVRDIENLKTEFNEQLNYYTE